MDSTLFDYHLPPDAIAQRPADARDDSRLLRLDRASGAIAHHRFRELPQLLRAGDLVVLNDTRVIPARLVMRRETGARIDGLYVRTFEDGRWEMMLRGRGRIREGERLEVEGADDCRLCLVENLGEGLWIVAPEPDMSAEPLLRKVGRPPLPPYIDRRERNAELDRQDEERYQTVFARASGAVAAPTAGLHFTQELLDELRRSEIEVAMVTLHVGLGTFRPVSTPRVEDHKMHAEWYHLSAETAKAANRARAEGRRIVAVGTTTVRVLETVARDGALAECEGETSLFIYPPFDFRIVGAMITNFHLPRSTLLMMVSAFAGREFLLRAYGIALENGYRFYSYGDACLIE